MAIRLGLAIACWLLLALSVGWYYTVTYFGRVGWPLPSIETVGALLLYYFSVLNVDTEIQAVHWLLVFPVAGLLWCLSLRWAPGNGAPQVLRMISGMGWAALPLALPAPYMMYLAGMQSDGWALERMTEVALRRGTLPPWSWLSPMYFLLGCVAFAFHIAIIRRVSPMPWIPFLRWIASASVLYVLMVALLGTVLSFPLRALLE